MKHSREQIEAMANAILTTFIPKDASESTLSFHFTIPPSSSYKVRYQKDTKGSWNFVGYETDQPDR